MKIRPYLPSTEHKAGKIIWLSIIIILLAMGYFSYLFFSVESKKTETFTQSKDMARQESPLTTVNSVSRYHGMHQYDIVAGVDKNGVQGYAFIPVSIEGNKDTSIRYYSNDEGITKNQIREAWERDCNGCKFIDMKPAINQDVPLWEITYHDEANRYVFDYYRMDNGKRYEVFRLKQ